MKKIFISYSWDSQEHKDWVAKLADELEKFEDFHVCLDQFDLDSKMDRHLFMENAVYESDVVIVISTKEYARKANARTGGVGEETFFNTGKLWKDFPSDKRAHTLNILREKEGTPRYLENFFHIDFTDDLQFEEKLSELILEINDDKKRVRPAKTKGLSTAKKKIIS
jgi:hypothetical protein